MKNAGYSLLNMVLSTGQMIFRGYVLMVMWAWFVVPQFTQAPHLTIPGAIGLSSLWGLISMNSISYLDYKAQLDLKLDEKTKWDIIRTGGFFIATLMIWLMGYIVHCFM